MDSIKALETTDEVVAYVNGLPEDDKGKALIQKWMLESGHLVKGLQAERDTLSKEREALNDRYRQ